jgi:oligopeptidase B
VAFHEPTKYVAKMRALNPGNTVVFHGISLPGPTNVVLLKCNMAGGHGGSSGRYDALKEQAFVTAFVLDQMGIQK